MAQTAPLRVMLSNGVKAVVDELRPQCERAVGRPLEIQFGTAVSLQQKIEAGEGFDVALLTAEVIDDLIRSGKVARESRVDLARCGIGVGVRAGAAKPAIGSDAALRRTLLDAKSIAYPGDGASRFHVEKMLGRLGIAAEVKPKTILGRGSAGTGASVASGEAQILFTLLSEIPPLPGVQLVGPLPADLQGYVYFAAGVSAMGGNAEAGKKLIKFLTGNEAGRVYAAKGMEQR